jgi:hypothetical protein
MSIMIEKRDDLKYVPIGWCAGVVCTAETVLEVSVGTSEKKVLCYFGKLNNSVKVCFVSNEPNYLDFEVKTMEDFTSVAKNATQKFFNSFGISDITPVFDMIRRCCVFVMCASILSGSISSALGGYLFPLSTYIS